MNASAQADYVNAFPDRQMADHLAFRDAKGDASTEARAAMRKLICCKHSLRVSSINDLATIVLNC
jgi:hypothetical protein